MSHDPFAGYLLSTSLVLRRPADHAPLGHISYVAGDPLPYRAMPARKPVGIPDPPPCASLGEALAHLDAFAPPLPPASLPVVLVDRQPSVTLTTYADGRVLDALTRGDIHPNDRPPGAGKTGRILALLHRHRLSSTQHLGGHDAIGGIKRLSSPRPFWAWHDAGGRQFLTLTEAFSWLHRKHLKAVGASAHAQLAFETTLPDLVKAMAVAP